jgi:chromosome segregation ATPase
MYPTIAERLSCLSARMHDLETGKRLMQAKVDEYKAQIDFERSQMSPREGLIQMWVKESAFWSTECDRKCNTLEELTKQILVLKQIQYLDDRMRILAEGMHLMQANVDKYQDLIANQRRQESPCASLIEVWEAERAFWSDQYGRKLARHSSLLKLKLALPAV